MVGVCHFALGAREARGSVCGDALVVGLVGGDEAFATSARKVDDERRHHEAGEGPTQLFVEVDDFLERRSKILDTLDHVALVDIVRLYVDIRKSLDEAGKRGKVVIDALK